MGCEQSSDSANLNDGPARKVDPRLPYERYRQVFTLRNHWKSVSRNLDNTAKDTLCRFFKQHPNHHALHPDLQNIDLENQEKLRDHTGFENVALDIFNMIDEVMECLENVDKAIALLNKFGADHRKLEGATMQYYKDMEGPFIMSVEDVLGDRFNDPAEENFRKFYGFMLKHIEEGFNGN